MTWIQTHHTDDYGGHGVGQALLAQVEGIGDFDCTPETKSGYD
jgi:hypothetical protein